MPAQPQRPIPPYAEVMYDFCDVLERIAQQNAAGPGWAKVLASGAVSNAAAYFPGAAKSVLGAELVATHKSTAAKLPVRFKLAPVDVVDQALDRARMTATEAAKNGPDAAIAAEIDQFFTALAQKYGVAGSAGASATLTDSGDQSKLATKNTKVDPLVAAIQSGGNWDGR
jgi:hypothetical protein